MATDLDVLQHGKVLEELHELEGANEARRRDLLRRPRGDVLAREHDAPGVRRLEAGNQVEQRGLAGAVRADHRGDAAFRRPRDRRRRRRQGRRYRRVTPCRRQQRHALAPARHQIAEAGQSLRRIDQQQDQARAIEQILIVLEAAKHLRQQADDHRAEDRAADGADAADIEHREGQHDHVQPEHLGADEPHHMHEQRARERRIGGRDQERRELVARDVDAERAGRVLAARDGGQRPAEARCAQPRGGKGRQHHDHHEREAACRDRTRSRSRAMPSGGMPEIPM